MKRYTNRRSLISFLAFFLSFAVLSGIVVAASFLANLLMIWQKNDAWMWWVIYSIAGIVLFSILLDPFLIVLNAAFLIINGGAHIAWIKMTQPGDFGWAKVIFRK